MTVDSDKFSGLISFISKLCGDDDAVTARLELGEEAIPLALTGGLVLGTELVRTRLLEVLEESGIRFTPVKLVPDPVVGAVRLARENLA